MPPSIGDLRKLEKDTLQLIATMNGFDRFPGLYDLAQKYRTIVGARGSISIECCIEMEIILRAGVGKTLAPCNVYIGALIEPTPDHAGISRTSYMLAICKDNRRTSPIIRKLHFDFEPIALRHSQEIKPSSHMQVCGELTPHLIECGYRIEHLKAWRPDYEKPRIPCMPMCLALLINWLLLEFQSDRTARELRNNAQWRNHVAEAERIVLKPYFDDCASFLNSAANRNKSFVEEKIYEVER